MGLSDSLYPVPEDDSDPHEIIPISFNMLEILKDSYHNTHIPEIEKYMIYPRSATETSGVILPEVQGTEKGINPNLK